MNEDQMQWKHNEPFFWSLFGAGGVVTAFITPILVLVIGILIPLGILPAEILDYERMLGFAGTLIGKLLLLVIIALTFWHCVHRIYHSLHDFGYHPGPGIKLLCYGIAFTLSIACLVLILVV